MIGEIAVITIPDILSPYSRTIGEVIIAQHPRVTTVLRKISKRDGCHRVAEYQPILGTQTRTIHRESGFTYEVDLATSFFSSRMSGERQRISAMIVPGEKVLIPFAGVGPFVIPVAARGGVVTAIEINPDACDMLQRNVLRNRCSEQVAIIQDDAQSVIPALQKPMDRVIIPTPYGLDNVFFPISQAVKPGGYIHYYTFQNRSDAQMLPDKFKDDGLETLRFHTCGNVAPAVSRWVYDLVKGF